MYFDKICKIMTEAKLKAKQIVEKEGLEMAKIWCRKIIDMNNKFNQLYPTEDNSYPTQFWGDVMDELNDMEE